MPLEQTYKLRQIEFEFRTMGIQNHIKKKRIDKLNTKLKNA
jgi:hypothetical protein